MSSIPPSFIVAAVAVLLITLGLLVYLLYRLRVRRREIVEELGRPRRALDARGATGPGRMSSADLAFNQMQLVRAELRVAQRDGLDARPARTLLEEADRRYGQREYDRALELARNAHESLVRLRLEPAAASASPPEPQGLPPGLEVFAPPASAQEETRPQVPRNQAEARFQLRVLETELTAARSGPSGGSALAEAEPIARQATAAYEAGQFTEAMRLALRARRRLGASIQTLPPPSAAPASATPLPTDAEPGEAEAARCPSCERPAGPGDRFCRGCGGALGPGRCPGCGAALEPGDAFCGRCGRPMAPGPA